MTAVDTPHRRYVCGGSCLLFAGSQHGRTCRLCLDAHVEATAALVDERLVEERAARLAQGRQRRGERDGGPATHRTVPPGWPT